MVIPQRNEEPLMTGEELARRPDLHCELVDGRVVPMPMTGYVHGTIEARLGAKLVAYADRTGRGIAMTGEVGIYIRHDPDTVRGSDALFTPTNAMPAADRTRSWMSPLSSSWRSTPPTTGRASR